MGFVSRVARPGADQCRITLTRIGIPHPQFRVCCPYAPTAQPRIDTPPKVETPDYVFPCSSGPIPRRSQSIPRGRWKYECWSPLAILVSSLWLLGGLLVGAPGAGIQRNMPESISLREFINHLPAYPAWSGYCPGGTIPISRYDGNRYTCATKALRVCPYQRGTLCTN